MTRWMLVLLVACSGSTRQPAQPTNESRARIPRIERGLAPAVQVRGEEVHYTLAERMREHRVPAVSIAVFEHGELQWAAAYGLAEVATGERATEDTQFLAGSISKTVNAYAALLAVRAGELALDAPINDALTSWKLPDNELTRKTPVTLRMLLSHTAGTTVHGFPGYAPGTPIPTLPQILDGAPPANTPAVRVDLAPGTEFRYSGGGTTIVQLALVERTYLPYPDLLARRVLGPTGMAHSTFDPARAQHPAVGYRASGDPVEGKRHIYPEMAAAGLWTTAGDLARFFARLARERKDPSSIAAQMTTTVKDAFDGAVGMGVFLTSRNGTPMFGHGGSDEGFQADAVASLDGGFGVVVMTSSDTGYKLMPEIERAVFAEYGWPGADRPVERFALDAAQRQRLVGRYLFDREPFEITAQGDKLMLDTPFDTPVELVPIAADDLVRRDDGRHIRADATGPIEERFPGGPSAPHRPITRLAGKHHQFELAAGNFDAAVAALRERLAADPQHAYDEENRLNGLGYNVLARDPAKAIEILRMVTTAVPASSNAHDSLGEAYMATGDKPRAIAEYERALATLDADPRVTPELRIQRRKHAEEQLAKLRR